MRVPKFKRRPVVLQQGAQLYSWTTDYFLSRQFADLSADRRSKHTLLLLDVPIGNSQSDSRAGWAMLSGSVYTCKQKLLEKISCAYRSLNEGQLSSDSRAGWATRKDTRVPSVEILRLTACYTTISKGVNLATMSPVLFCEILLSV